MGIVPNGEILYLPHALERHSNKKVVLYCRVSEISQVNRGSLESQKQHEIASHRLLGVTLVSIVAGQERGQVRGKRPHLLDALDRARRHNAIVCCSSLDRFIRAEDYNRRTNRRAWPTEEEFAELHELADGVVLATRMPPINPTWAVHSAATKRNGRCGRPSQVGEMRGLAILQDQARGLSLAQIALQHGLTKSTVQRFIDKWKQHADPATAYAEMLRDKLNDAMATA